MTTPRRNLLLLMVLIAFVVGAVTIANAGPPKKSRPSKGSKSRASAQASPKQGKQIGKHHSGVKKGPVTCQLKKKHTKKHPPKPHTKHHGKCPGKHHGKHSGKHHGKHPGHHHRHPRPRPPSRAARYNSPMQPITVAPLELFNETNETFQCRISGRLVTFTPGRVVPLEAGRVWLIEFDRGGPFGKARYELARGIHHFVQSDRGLALVPVD